MPGKGFNTMVSFTASIGIGFTLSASISLAVSSTFQGRTDDTAVALLTNASKIFAWGASAYGVALIASVVGIIVMETKSIVVLLQEVTSSSSKDQCAR